MVAEIALLLALLLAATGPAVSGAKRVPAPPGGKFEPGITAVVTDRAKAQMKVLVEQFEKDPAQPSAVKAEVRRKASLLSVAVYTTGSTIEEVAIFYTERVPGASFLFAERDIGVDLLETAAGGTFTLPPSTFKAWEGKKGRFARWARPDGALEIDLEDHLIDPRDGRVTKQTVVMVTSAGS